jgi:predicted nucleic acid-binding protein
VNVERVYADTCVVINAFKGAQDVVRKRCQELLGNPDIEVLFCDIHRLELLPKPIREKNQLEKEFMEAFFAEAKYVDLGILGIKPVVNKAIELAARYGVRPLDALHVSAAIMGKAERFITTEASNSPMLRVKEIRVETFAT